LNKRELAELVESQAGLLEDIRIDRDNLEERLADLELALEDQGWYKLGWLSEREFSRDGLRTINMIARYMYLKNPLIKQGVDVQTRYVFGQGMNIASDQEPVNDVIQGFLNDSKNRAELTSHQSRMGKETELQLYSNIFFVFFTDTDGKVRVRTIPCDEVSEIITNPEDRKEPWYYKREWSQSSLNMDSGIHEAETITAYYPDWRYQPGSKPVSIGSKTIEWESPVYHVKTGGLPDMQFGVSEVYPALDWARAYKEFLENWSTIVKAYARFAWSLTTKGGADGVAAAKTKLQSTLGTGSGETNPPPLTGSTFLSTEGVDMKPMKTAGATTKAEDGRRLLLMVASTMGLPETFFGDVSVGTLATAKSMDRPTELKMVSRQTLWADIYRAILDYVIRKAIDGGTLDGTVTEEDDGTPNIEVAVDGQLESPSINVDFPPILEHDVSESIKSIVTAGTLNGKVPAGTIDMETLSRLLLSALGVENIDALIDQMFNEEPTEEARSMVDAVKGLRESINELIAAAA